MGQTETKLSVGLKTPRVRKHRWRRRVFITSGVVIPVLLLMTWQVMSRSWFLAPRIETVLSQLVGGDVTIVSARLKPTGLVIIRGLEVQVPEVANAPGRLVRIDSLEAVLDRGDLLHGRLTLRRVEISDAVVRISEDLESGEFNFGHLSPVSTGPNAVPIALPRIVLNSARIEVGEQVGMQFTQTGTLDVSGELRREDSAGLGGGDRSWYAFDVSESGTPDRSLLRVEGRVNLTTGEASVVLHSVTFDERRGGLLPSVARKWWDITQPSGSLQPIIVQVTSDGEYSVEIIMDGIDWSLPLPGFQSAEQTDAPRMDDARGTIVIGSDGISLVGLWGGIDGVRYQLNGDFDEADPDSGFDVTFTVEQFDLERNLSVLTAFPESIRRMVDSQLVQLGGPTGRLDAKIRFRRDPMPKGTRSSAAAPRAVRVSGRVELFNAEGSYSGFAYPLQGMSGTIEFDDTELRIVNVAGSGPDGGRVFLSGTIAPLEPDPSVHVDLYAVKLPIDETLTKALGERNGRHLQQFIDTGMEARLHEQGLFITDRDVDRLREQAMEAIRQFRALTGDSNGADDPATKARVEEITARMKDCEAQLKKPLFNLGGRINVQSTIAREAGPDQPIKVENRIRLASTSAPIGLLYDEFPYPVYLVDGELLVAYDRISITRDLVLVGPTGARAVVSGDIKRLRVPKRRMDHRLHLTADGVPLDALLAHAIPASPGRKRDNMASDAWPSKLSIGGRVLAGLHLEGECAVEGRITSDDKGKPQFDLDVLVEDAQTRSTPETSAQERPADQWWWPQTHALSDVSAHLTIHRDRLEINDFTGRHNGETFTARGNVQWHDQPAIITLNAGGTKINLDPSLLDLAGALAGERRLEAMRGFWSGFNPTGTADVRLDYVGSPGEAREGQTIEESLRLTVYPQRGAITIGGQRGSFRGISGWLEMDDQGAVFRDFGTTVVSADNGSDGRINLNGRLGWRTGEPTSDLNGTLESGQVQSPFLRAIVEAFGSEKPTSFLDELNIDGMIDADFVLREGPGDGAQFEANIEPQQLSLDWYGQRFDLRDMAGVITMGTDHVRFNEFQGTYQDGHIGIIGDVWLGSTVTTDLGLAISADGLTPRVRALLPSAVDRVIDAIDLQVATRFELADARMQWTGHRRERAADDAGGPERAALFDVESVDFEGRISVEDASLRLSVPISDVDGDLTLNVSRFPGEDWFNGTIGFDIDRMKLLGRQVTNVRATMQTGDAAGEIILPMLAGRCYGGRISAKGRAQLPLGDSTGSYALDLSLADVAIDPILHPDAYDTADDQAWAPMTDRLHKSGLTHGRLSIAGELGQVDTRRGRGTIRVTSAQLYEVPLALWALQLSALALPVSTSFDTAEMDFFVDGQTVVFEHVSLESPALTVKGEGTLDVGDQSVDLRFSSDARFSIPLISDLWMWLRDALVTLHVTGTLDNPETALETTARQSHTSRPAHVIADGER